MKILILDEEFPWPLNTGKRIRTYNLVCSLAQAHQVTYLAYGSPESESSRALAAAGVEPVSVPEPNRKKSGLRFYLRLLWNLSSPLPYIVTSHYSRAFQKKVETLAGDGGYDLIVCEWTPYGIFVKDLSSPKQVLVAHNIESHIWKRYEAHERNPLRRWYITHQRKKVQAFEAAAFGWVDGATAVSAQEAEELRPLVKNERVEVIENGVDAEYFARREDPVENDLLVFTGSMDWRPNQDAAHWFVKRVWPHLQKARPELRAFFVGRDPSPDVLALGQVPGITITGTVPDVRPMIARAAVYIVPLRIGGGSRLKILEALSMEKAVVSTRVGAEGLLVEDGRNVVLADSPEDFSAAVLACLEDPSRCRELGVAGRELITDHYRWQRIGDRYSRFLEGVAGSPKDDKA